MGRERPDHYARRAKREGYRARSVYKLQEISRRFGLLRPGASVLDIGAAPGSWTQLAAKAVGTSGRVVAVDIASLAGVSGLANVTAVLGDVTDTVVAVSLARMGPFDLVMSDAAPSTSGNRGLDTARSAAIVEAVIAIAVDALKPGGNLIAKVFQGGEEQQLLSVMRELFESARMVKPGASRSESFEAFLVGLQRRSAR